MTPFSFTRKASHSIWRRRFSQELQVSRSIAEKKSKEWSWNSVNRPVRVRFTPQASEHTSLNTLRLALLNYLFAKSANGKLIINLRDVDPSIPPGWEVKLFDHLRWLGIQWDEGPGRGGRGPFRQSKRFGIYRDHALMLLHYGRAFRCFCGKEHLESLAAYRRSLKLSAYDGKCAFIPPEEADDRAVKGEAHIVRLRKEFLYPDKPFQKKSVSILGAYKAGRSEGQILLNSDGRPDPLFANVVDDHEMNISHVLRQKPGNRKATRYTYLRNSFGWGSAPTFVDIGYLANADDGSKLSKGTAGDTELTVDRLKELGALPEAVANFLALLGRFGEDKKRIMTLEELIQNFKPIPFFAKNTASVVLSDLLHFQAAHAERLAKSNDGRIIKELVQQINQELEVNRQDLLEGLNKIMSHEQRINHIREILRAHPEDFTSAKAYVAKNEIFFKAPN